MIESNYCEFCSKTFVNRNNLFSHYKTISHIEKTEVNVDKQLMTTVWSKHVLEQLPTPYEREFLYKYCQRNWNEKIGDGDNQYRIRNGTFPDYISDAELYDWYNHKKTLLLNNEGEKGEINEVNEIIPYEMRIEEV